MRRLSTWSVFTLQWGRHPNRQGQRVRVVDAGGYQRHVRALQHRARFGQRDASERDAAKTLRKQLAGKLALLKRLGMPVLQMLREFGTERTFARHSGCAS